MTKVTTLRWLGDNGHRLILVRKHVYIIPTTRHHGHPSTIRVVIFPVQFSLLYIVACGAAATQTLLYIDNWKNQFVRNAMRVLLCSAFDRLPPSHVVACLASQSIKSNNNIVHYSLFFRWTS